MVKAKRVTGGRDAPNLPALKAAEVKLFMWKGVTKASWTLEEAAYYVNEENPDHSKKKIDPKSNNDVSKTYMWLLQEVSQNRLHPIPYGEEDFFSPGAIMRHIWEGWKNVSLNVWALYDQYSNQSFSKSLVNEISIPFYDEAANIVRSMYPEMSNGQVAELISPLPDYFKDDPEFHFVPKMAVSTIEERLKGSSSRKKGRPKKTEQRYNPEIDEVIGFIKEKMGAKIGSQ